MEMVVGNQGIIRRAAAFFAALLLVVLFSACSSLFPIVEAEYLGAYCTVQNLRGMAVIRVELEFLASCSATPLRLTGRVAGYSASSLGCRWLLADDRAA